MCWLWDMWICQGGWKWLIYGWLEPWPVLCSTWRSWEVLNGHLYILTSNLINSCDFLPILSHFYFIFHLDSHYSISWIPIHVSIEQRASADGLGYWGGGWSQFTADREELRWIPNSRLGFYIFPICFYAIIIYSMCFFHCYLVCIQPYKHYLVKCDILKDTEWDNWVTGDARCWNIMMTSVVEIIDRHWNL